MSYDVKIISLVYEGYGLGRLPDGRAVFIPFVLPGERVRIDITKEKKRYVFGRVLEILEPSPERVNPKCKHYTICGGCHFQHIPYEKQLIFKERIFEEQLARVGGIESAAVEKNIPSREVWNYRNTVQFHPALDGELGYFDAGNAYVVPVKECHLPMKAIDELWPHLAFEGKSDIERVEIRQNEMGELLVNLQSAHSAIPEIDVTASLSLVHTGPNDSVVISGDEYLLLKLSGREFRVAANSFFQTNFYGAEVLVKNIEKMVGGLNGTIFDLYSGVGLFSAFLHDQFDHIIAIEGSESACADYTHNFQNCDDVDLFEGFVEKVLPDISETADCAIIDPPRRGMHRFAVDALIEKNIPRIVYVSCNPATLARDLKRLVKGGYMLAQSILVDMFPQTYHIESVNLLELR